MTCITSTYSLHRDYCDFFCLLYIAILASMDDLSGSLEPVPIRVENRIDTSLPPTLIKVSHIAYGMHHKSVTVSMAMVTSSNG
jgi:hypothetical protein